MDRSVSEASNRRARQTVPADDVGPAVRCATVREAAA
jgi:hypothetical protein